ATNGDIAAMNALDGKPISCFSGNRDSSGLTTSPSGLQQTNPTCNGASVPANANPPLALELLCGNEGTLVDANIPCPGGKAYPRRTHVVMHALPTSRLRTMPHVCRDVPANPWCAPPPRPTGGKG